MRKRGKDKISDLTVNLIKKYLCEYTENFAKKIINPDLCKYIPVEKAYFNYETESFVSKKYFLPYIYNYKNEIEYILLTPFDIIRADEPAVNKKDFYLSHERIRAAIDNDNLRAYINNYISKAIVNYKENHKKPLKENVVQKLERNAFKEVVQEYPQLYDYYIKLRESSTEEIKAQCMKELDEQLEKLSSSPKVLIKIFNDNGYSIEENLSAREEAKKRLIYFKHIIEDCDGYKNLYLKGVKIAKENDLQRLFRFVWYGTNYKVNSEPNNGRGQADFIISMGQKNQNIVEFNLSSNETLGHVFKQVKIYEVANCADGSLIAIFYFSEEEYLKAKHVIEDAGNYDKIDESIFLIDCRCDNKKSDSIA